MQIICICITILFIQNFNLPLQVVNSIFLAFSDLMKDSDTIIGVYAKSQPYLRTRSLKGNLYWTNKFYQIISKSNFTYLEYLTMGAQILTVFFSENKSVISNWLTTFTIRKEGNNRQYPALQGASCLCHTTTLSHVVIISVSCYSIAVVHCRDV